MRGPGYRRRRAAAGRSPRRRALIDVDPLYLLAVGVYVTYAVELLKRDADPEYEPRNGPEIVIRDP